MTPVDLRLGEGEGGLGVQLPDDRSKPGSATHLLEDSKLRFRVSEARRVCSFEKEKEKKNTKSMTDNLDSLPIPNIFNELFARWMREIHPKDF